MIGDNSLKEHKEEEATERKLGMEKGENRQPALFRSPDPACPMNTRKRRKGTPVYVNPLETERSGDRIQSDPEDGPEIRINIFETNA